MLNSGAFVKGQVPWNKGGGHILLPLEDRFWAKVNKTNTCWLWTGSKNIQGYGKINIGGVNKLAHRVSLEMDGLKVADGKFVLHKCDIPACVNPSHLYVGTQADNMRDMSVRNRVVNQNTNKTHCKYGHEFTTENTMLNKKGRGCRECNRLALRKRKIEKGY